MRLLIILTLVFSMFAFGGSKAPEEDPISSWQQSESLNIQLAVRDKNSVMEIFEAVFIVENIENGLKFEKTIKVPDDDWGFVYFPDDFPPGAKDGEYEWKCVVNGNVVSSGNFKFSENHRNLFIPKK
ncbi:MAG: hypothetical protein KKD38_09055 [Candidatus Delongbacteria bacterium]|nr:hypothetical protein [Candidatus Delongbacteria bacterium]MCG2761144.1 hypothetical protein [Candidatus Delongbacteria bacterium]